MRTTCAAAPPFHPQRYCPWGGSPQRRACAAPAPRGVAHSRPGATHKTHTRLVVTPSPQRKKHAPRADQARHGPPAQRREPRRHGARARVHEGQDVGVGGLHEASARRHTDKTPPRERPGRQDLYQRGGGSRRRWRGLGRPLLLEGAHVLHLGGAQGGADL